MDAATRAERWRFQADASLEMTPTVGGGRVFIPSANGTLYAIDSADAAPMATSVTMSEASPVAEAPPVAFLWASSGGPDPLVLPPDLAVHPDGTVWLLDAGNNRVQILSPDGDYLETWGEAGSGQLDGPSYLAVEAAGNIYVADIKNGRIQRFRLLPPLVPAR